MKLYQAIIVAASLLLLSACTLIPEASCGSGDCQQLGANIAELNVWWSPALRDGGGEYSTVSLND
ncbi:hypothetical protein [Pseudomonas sp. 13B_3.2_Bac1]|uniref:hypothetical protein n=1 Tax=Pseudomonas sp. 13B_3.2_Bac1 TaxID=2971623 RepID=UPI0021C6C7FB|nr:hypothetical protein [Pseudomonas sp. 13B_3.2_Bac1]MCU1771347.1 hypothetical protein [Pseudomonas sp. 13B_3.2_Bac1]